VARSDAAALLPLAESIADGSQVDWEAAEAHASDDEKAIIRQLRVLSNLAVLHRSLPTAKDASAAVTRRSQAAPAIGSWAHLALVERLGGGSFGEVYRAWDRQLEREVALKLMRDESVDDLQASRITMEGRLLARLHHPNVITVHGVAVHEHRVGLWMELVRGATLEQSLQKRGPFSAREAALVGIDLCRALAAIHAAGLIHRDVKAQNVMREDGGRVVLMDLGTGREVDPAGRRPLSDLAGTPLYLAPEIFEGTPASERSDLYSLGVLLYHLVTGSFPARATTIEELREVHAKGGGVRLRDARADLPTEFVRVVDRAIAREPNRRYASAGALEADLMGALGESAAAPASVAVAPPKRRNAWWIGAAAAAAALMLVVPAVRNLWWPAPVLGSRDTVLVADFTNNTGVSTFDGALKEALTVQLQQSPYLNALGATSVEEGLRQMGYPPRTPVSGQTARVLCQKEGIKAMILGSISSIGNQFQVAVQARNCETEQTIAARTQTASLDGVLGALGAVTTSLRKDLGESLKSIEQFNVPVKDATTASLDALKAYSVGMEARAQGDEAGAIPAFNHALELDPRFALAEAKLASIYANLHEHEQSKVHTKKAFDLSEHVTEREKLYIKGSYHIHVTGDLDEAIGVYDLWAKMYPNDWLPHNNRAAQHYRRGQFDDALKEAEIARSLGPEQVIPYEQVAETYVAMGRFSDAKDMVNQAQARGLNAAHNRALLLRVALVEGGVAAVRKQFEALDNRSTDYTITAVAAQAEAFAGDFAAARSLSAQAVAKAQAARMNDVAASLIAEDALNAALANESDYAHKAVDRALAIGHGTETVWSGSLAAAFSGRRKMADQLADEYVKVTPPTTDVVTVSVPVLRAASALAGGEYQRAIEALQPALPYERVGRFWPAYIRGLAYLGLKQPREAASQFQSILNHRGDAPTSILFPLASLQLGRAFRAAGDVPAARRGYDAFIAAWSGAKRDQPVLAAATRERSRLGS
jgi:eukaryotic-like serine/threonine-protein kinase